MTSEELSYWAGLFDGEGSVLINRNGKRKDGSQIFVLRCTLSLSDPHRSMLLAMKDDWGGSVTSKPARGPLSKKDSWTWSVSVSDARNFIQTILPFLRLKREEALVALKFDGTNGEEIQAKVREARLGG